MAETIEIPAGVRCRVDSDEPPYQDIDKDLTYPPESPT
jgi:hypothetical protein